MVWVDQKPREEIEQPGQARQQYDWAAADEAQTTPDHAEGEGVPGVPTSPLVVLHAGPLYTPYSFAMLSCSM